jgi:hypothetical protein
MLNLLYFISQRIKRVEKAKYSSFKTNYTQNKQLLRLRTKRTGDIENVKSTLFHEPTHQMS